jgi:hypothetical protein
MVQYKNNQRKNLARSLRKGGYSYAEIQKFVNVPKATLSMWFKDIELTPAQADRLRKKRSDAIRQGTKSRSEQVARTIEQIEMAALKDIGKISKRELWLLGVMLYWRNKNKQDVRKGVSFMSNEPHLIRLFLKWIQEIGQIPREEIIFDIFLGGVVSQKKSKKSKQDSKYGGEEKGPRNRSDVENKVVNFWAIETGFPQENFVGIYYYKREVNPILRVRVKASSMLARQIAGWIEGIKSNLT